jgi:hypothetical protein
MGSRDGNRGGAVSQSDPYAARREELLNQGEARLRDDERVRREVAEFDTEMRRRRDASSR